MSKLTIAKAEKPRASALKTGGATAKGLSITIKPVAKRAADLGNGFYLIDVGSLIDTTIHRSKPMTPAQPLKLPGIAPLPENEIDSVLRRFTRRSRTAKLMATKRKVQPKSEAVAEPNEGNKAWLAEFSALQNKSIARLAAQGKLIDSKEMAERLEISRQAVNKAIQDLRMFTLDGAGGVKLIPAFFADQRLERKQLETISKELDLLPSTSKWQFFTSPRLSLSKKSPVEALRKGKFAEVMAAAKAFKEA